MDRSAKGYLITGTQITKKWGKAASTMYLVLALGVIRLEKQKTDVLISLNSAFKCSEAEVRNFETNDGIDSAALGRIGLARKLVRNAIREFEVVDWNLFVAD